MNLVVYMHIVYSFQEHNIQELEALVIQASYNKS